MKNKLITISILCLFATACTNIPGTWQNLSINPNLYCDSLHSEAYGKSPMRCIAWMEGDTLTLHLSQISWQHITLQIYGGKFNAQLSGVPLYGPQPTFTTLQGQLTVGQAHYTTGDTLRAQFDLHFRLTDPETHKTHEWNPQGTLCEVIREKDFDPTVPQNFMQFDLPTAIHQIGDPLTDETFNMTNPVGEFYVELLNYLPPGSTPVIIRELTWDISPTASLSDEGSQRLTIWYLRRQDKIHLRESEYSKIPYIWNRETARSEEWLPLHYTEWDTGMQF